MHTTTEATYMHIATTGNINAYCNSKQHKCIWKLQGTKMHIATANNIDVYCNNRQHKSILLQQAS